MHMIVAGSPFYTLVFVASDQKSHWHIETMVIA
jgi:hypothetical protein